MASGLGGFGKLRLKSLGLGGHLEDRPSTFRDADRDVGEGRYPFGEGVSGHRVLNAGAVGDIDRVRVTRERLIDDTAKQGRLRFEANIDGTRSDLGAHCNLGKGGGHVALLKEKLAGSLNELGLGLGHPPGSQVWTARKLMLDVIIHKVQYNCIDTV